MTFLVLTPTRGTLFTRTHDALMREFVRAGQYPLWTTTDGLKLLDARNTLVARALASRAPWDAVLFLDDDVVLPEGSFPAFEKKLKESDVAVMDYPHHWHPLLSDTPPAGVTVFTQWLPGEDVSLKKIAWSGLGAVAIRRPALELLSKERSPLFRASANPVVPDPELGIMRLEKTADRGIGGQKASYSGGEDTQFFFDCRALGLSIGLVPELTAAHLRLDHAVSWVADDKYSTVHTVEESSRIEVPGNALHREKTN